MKSWRKIAIITRFELIQNLRSGMFLLTMIALPLLSVGMTVVPLHLTTSQPQPVMLTMGVYDELYPCSSQLNEYFDAHYHNSGRWPHCVFIPLRQEPAPDEQYNAVLRFHLDHNSLTVVCQSRGYEIRQVVPAIEQALKTIVNDTLSVTVVQTTERIGAETSIATRAEDRVLGVVGLNILTLLLITGIGQTVVRSLFEENNSSLIDVLFTSADAVHIVLGKWLPVLVVGLIHCLLWTGVMVLCLSLVSDGDYTATIAQVAVHAFLCFASYAALYMIFAAAVADERTAVAWLTLTSLSTVVLLSLLSVRAFSDEWMNVSVLGGLPLIGPFATSLELLNQVPISTTGLWLRYAVVIATIGGLMVVSLKLFTRRVRYAHTRVRS